MAAQRVKVGQQFELSGEKFRVARLAGKEARLVKVGVKSDDASEAAGTVKYRRLTTLEAMLGETKPKRSRNAETPAEPESPVGELVVA